MTDEREYIGSLIERAIGSTSTRERNRLADALQRSGPVWHTFASHASAGGMRINPGDRLLVVAYGRKLKTFRPIPGQRDAYRESAAIPLESIPPRRDADCRGTFRATLSFRSGRTRAIGRECEPWPTPEPDPSIKPPWED